MSPEGVRLWFGGVNIPYVSPTVVWFPRLVKEDTFKVVSNTLETSGEDVKLHSKRVEEL